MRFAPRRALRAALVGGASAALFAGVIAATPVQADEAGTVDLSVTVPAQSRDNGRDDLVTLPFDADTKDLRVMVRNAPYAAATATGVTLTFTLPKGTDAGSVTLAEGAERCTMDTETTGTCTLDDLKPGSITNLRLFTVHSTKTNPNAKGRIGKVTVAVSAAEEDTDSTYDEHVFVVGVHKKSRPDLATWVRENDLVVRPGETGAIDADDYTITNDSASPAKGLVLLIALPEHMAFTEVPEGCEDLSTEGSTGVLGCALPDLVIEGESTITPISFPYAIAGDAPDRAHLAGDVTIVAVNVDPVEPEIAADVDAQDVVLTAPGVSEEEVEAQLDAAEEPENLMTAAKKNPEELQQTFPDNTAFFAVFTYADQADLSVTAETPDTTVGETTTTTVTVANQGPWAIDESVTLDFTIPSGTTVADLPSECSAAEGSATVSCTLTGGLDVDASTEFTLTLRADVVGIGGEGSVTVSSGQPDPKLENNTAAITFAVADDGTGPNPDQPPADGDDDASGDLPVTGTSLTFMGVAAAALLAAGAAFLIVSRRRKTAVTAGESDESDED